MAFSQNFQKTPHAIVVTYNIDFQAYQLYTTYVIRTDLLRHHNENAQIKRRLTIFLAFAALWLIHCGTVSSISPTIEAQQPVPSESLPTAEDVGQGGQGGEIDMASLKEVVMEMVRNSSVAIQLLPDPQNEGMSLGSGAILAIADDGSVTIRTAYHVVHPDFEPKTINILTAAGSFEFSIGSVQIVDEKDQDLAEITFKPWHKIEGLRAIDTGTAAIGDTVFLISYASQTEGGGNIPRTFDRVLSVHAATVIETPTELQLDGVLPLEWLQFFRFEKQETANSTWGGSGGAWVNFQGQLIATHLQAHTVQDVAVGIKVIP